MGYIPNTLARSLSSRRSKVIGMVLGERIRGFYAPYIIDSIQEELIKLGYATMMLNSANDIALERQHLETLLKYRVHSIIVLPVMEAPKNIDHYLEIMKSAIGLVFVDRYVLGLENVGYVGTDNYTAMYEATRYMLQKGYSSFTYLGLDDVTSSKERLAGFKKAIINASDRNRDITADYHLLPSNDSSVFHQYILDHIAINQLHQVYVCMSFVVAQAVLIALYTLPKAVRTKIEVVTFDEGDTARYFDIPTLCLVQDCAKIGSACVRQATGDDMPATIRIKPLWCHYGA